MRPHRFAFNFGYGFDAEDDAMMDPSFLFVSMFLELALEVVIDCAAIDIERLHGIDIDKFWEMVMVNPGNFFGVHISASSCSLYLAFWAFSTLPSPFFCVAEHDPCSCTGGGFQIFKPFCDAAPAATTASCIAKQFLLGVKLATHAARNASSSCHVQANSTNTTDANATATTQANKTLEFVKNAARSEYVGILESLEDGGAVVAITVAVIVVIVLVFAIARSQLFAAEANRERDEADRQRVELLEQNKRIQEQLALNALSEEQAEIVHEGAAALEARVPTRFKISSKKITFESLLGSGSFGDCYRGSLQNFKVAVKQMRVVSRVSG